MDAGQAAARRGRIVTRYLAAILLAAFGAFMSAVDGRYRLALIFLGAAAGTAVAARRKRRDCWLREA